MPHPRPSPFPSGDLRRACFAIPGLGRGAGGWDTKQEGVPETLRTPQPPASLRLSGPASLSIMIWPPYIDRNPAGRLLKCPNHHYREKQIAWTPRREPKEHPGGRRSGETGASGCGSYWEWLSSPAAW